MGVDFAVIAIVALAVVLALCLAAGATLVVRDTVRKRGRWASTCDRLIVPSAGNRHRSSAVRRTGVRRCGAAGLARSAAPSTTSGGTRSQMPAAERPNRALQQTSGRDRVLGLQLTGDRQHLYLPKSMARIRSDKASLRKVVPSDYHSSLAGFLWRLEVPFMSKRKSLTPLEWFSNCGSWPPHHDLGTLRRGIKSGMLDEQDESGMTALSLAVRAGVDVPSPPEAARGGQSNPPVPVFGRITRGHVRRERPDHPLRSNSRSVLEPRDPSRRRGRVTRLTHSKS